MMDLSRFAHGSIICEGTAKRWLAAMVASSGSCAESALSCRQITTAATAEQTSLLPCLSESLSPTFRTMIWVQVVLPGSQALIVLSYFSLLKPPRTRPRCSCLQRASLNHCLR